MFKIYINQATNIFTHQTNRKICKFAFKNVIRKKNKMQGKYERGGTGSSKRWINKKYKKINEILKIKFKIKKQTNEAIEKI